MSVEAEHSGHDHIHVSHQFEDLDQQIESYIVGMWTFLVTEIMFFGALFLALTVYRSLHTEDFNEAHKHLDKMLGATNTMILLISSLTMALSVRAAQIGNKKATQMFLGFTLICAFGFLSVKAIEYKSKWDHHLIPGPTFAFKSVAEEEAEAKNGGIEVTRPQQITPTPYGGNQLTPTIPQGQSAKFVGSASGSNDIAFDPNRQQLPQDGKQLFFCLYFIMTGLHAIHIIIGIGIMGIIFFMVKCDHPAVRDYMPLEMTALYWHFVDIVWIFLFPILYLVGH